MRRLGDRVTWGRNSFVSCGSWVTLLRWETWAIVLYACLVRLSKAKLFDCFILRPDVRKSQSATVYPSCRICLRWEWFSVMLKRPADLWCSSVSQRAVALLETNKMSLLQEAQSAGGLPMLHCPLFSPPVFIYVCSMSLTLTSLSQNFLWSLYLLIFPVFPSFP